MGEEKRWHYKLKFEYQSQQMLISIFNKFSFSPTAFKLSFV